MSQFFTIMFCSSVPLILHFVFCFLRVFLDLFWQLLPRFLAYLYARRYCVCISYVDSIFDCFVVDVCSFVVFFFYRVCCTFVCVLMSFQLFFFIVLYLLFVVADFALYLYRDKCGVCEFWGCFCFAFSLVFTQ